MAHRRETMPSWIDVFPIAEEAETSKSDVLFVDMGGNMGHECARLKARYPDLPGRVILQDLPYATSLALETPGVENTEHDLFTPQPVKGLSALVLGILSDIDRRQVLLYSGRIA